MSDPGPVFAVDPSVFERFPDFIVGCVLARGIDNRTNRPEVERLLVDAEKRARTVYGDLDLKEEPPFQVWRQAFSTAGWSASRFPSSVEALVKRVARGLDAPRISPVVDLSNAAALLYAVPVGAHDIATHAKGPLTVRAATHGDIYLPLGDGAPESPDAGEIIYASGSDVRTRRWVWRQSRSALIEPESCDVFFPVDGFAESTASRVEAARDFVGQICREIFKADVTLDLVTKDNPRFNG